MMNLSRTGLSRRQIVAGCAVTLGIYGAGRVAYAFLGGRNSDPSATPQQPFYGSAAPQMMGQAVAPEPPAYASSPPPAMLAAPMEQGGAAAAAGETMAGAASTTGGGGGGGAAGGERQRRDAAARFPGMAREHPSMQRGAMAAPQYRPPMQRQAPMAPPRQFARPPMPFRPPMMARMPFNFFRPPMRFGFAPHPMGGFRRR